MKTMYFIILLLNLFFNIKIDECRVDNAKRVVEVPLSIVEYYKIDEYLYMFFSERVTWDEAETICPNYDAQLSVVNTPFKANKLAAAMAESNIEMEDIWIGGQRSDKGIWEWVNRKRLPSESSHGFPPWVRIPNRPSKQCVALHRFAVDLPLFVDLDCRLSKPFMCQRDSDTPGNPDVALPSQIIKYAKSTYILYHARVSWGNAAAFCRIRGYRLAIVPNNEVAKIVSSAMIRSRPSFENVWISGHYSHNKWTWLPTGDTMPNYPNENNYPPWHHNSTRQTSGCILFDRHVCDDPVFLALSCDHKRDFVCEKYTKGSKHHKKADVIRNITFHQMKMSLVLKELSWNDAQDYCHDANGYLAEVYDYDMLKMITTVMSDQETEPIHAWLGGILVNDTWTWAKSKEAIPISYNKTGFIPWCDIEQKEDDNCLNLDREAHDKPVVYGLNCEVRQPFICIMDDKTNILDDYPPATSFKYDTSSFTVFFTPYSYESSMEQCSKAGGKLAELKDDEIGEIIDNILSTNIKVSRDMNFWTQAKVKCSQLNLTAKRVEGTSDCSKKQGFICKPICSKPKSDKFNKTAWTCSGNRKIECKIECTENTILVGPDALVCDDLGWVTGANTTNYLPTCQSNDFVTNGVIDLTRRAIDDYTGLLFIADESYSVNREEWSIQLQFIASMIQVFPLSVNLTMGLIMFSSTVQIPVPFNATNTCTVLEILKRLIPDKERDFTYIKEALEEADNQIKKFHRDQPTIIYIISDGDNNGDEFNEIMFKLKKKHLIISIGINTETLSDLGSLASEVNDELLMYNFQKFSFFKDHTLALMKFRSQHLHCNQNLYTVLTDLEKQDTTKVRKRQYVPTNETFCDNNPISIEIKGVTYTIFFLPSTYADAKLHCMNEGGRLANVMDNNQLEIIANSLVNRAESCNEVEVWINSHQRCVILHIGSKKVNNCTEPDSSTQLGFICENGCADPPTDTKYIYNSWNCNIQGKFKNCHVKCKGKAVLVGTSIMICKAEGWITLNNQSTNFPICLINDDFESKFIHQIGKLKEEHEGFLFVFDKQKNDKIGTLKQLDFMKIILEIFPSSENFPVGLILLDGDAKIYIPYNETNFCMVRRKLHRLKHTAMINKSENSKNLYNAALLEVEKQITTFQPIRKTLIFLISDRPNSGNNYTNILNKLKINHTIFSIGGNYDSLKDLNNLASIDSGNLLMYTFKSYEHLDYTMKIIKQHRGKHYKCEESQQNEK